VTIVSDPVTPTINVPLSGTGLAPVASVVPTSLTFASQLVNTTSGAQAVTLTNTGSATLTINSITLTGANAAVFAQTNGCGGTLAAGANCSISVTFTPTAAGAAFAGLAISSNDPVNPTVTVPLSGTGTTPIAGVSPPSLAFGSQQVTTTSVAQTVTLSNTGTATLGSVSIGLTGGNAGDFAQTNGCGASLAAAGSCTISVTFTPTATGARSTTLRITSSDPVNPTIDVPLSGTGVSGIAGVAPTSLTFASQLVATTSGAQTVTVSNTGAGLLGSISITITGTNPGDFGMSNGCGASLAAGATCNVSVTFAPTAAGALSANLTVTSNDSAHSPLNVSLSGTAVLVVPTVSPASLTFSTPLNVPSAPQTVTVSNPGATPVSITSITFGGSYPNQFTKTTTCGASLAAGASCTVSVTFSPNSASPTTKTATLKVNVAAPATSQSVSLTGTIIVPTYTLSPTSLAFGTQTVNTTSAARAVTVTNTGTVAALTINSIAVTGGNVLGQYAQTNTCGPVFPASLAAGTTCTITVTFTPTATGVKTSTLAVTVAAPATSQSVSLSGTGQ
jgi:hypothetical protein